MFLFRSVFITAMISIAFLAQASAWVLPLTRYMLDAVPEGTDTGAESDTDAVSAHDASVPLSPQTDVPTAVDSSPVPKDQHSDSPDEPSALSFAAASSSTPSSVIDAAVPSYPASSSAENAPVSQANVAGHIGGLGSTTVLFGSVVAGILLTV